MILFLAIVACTSQAHLTETYPSTIFECDRQRTLVGDTSNTDVKFRIRTLARQLYRLQVLFLSGSL